MLERKNNVLHIASSSLSALTWTAKSSHFESTGFFLPYEGATFGGDAFALVEKKQFCYFYIADATGHGEEGALFWKEIRFFFEELWTDFIQQEPTADVFQKFAEKLNVFLVSDATPLPKNKTQLCLTIGVFATDGTLDFIPFGYGTHLLAQGEVAYPVARRFGLKLGWFSNTQRASMQVPLVFHFEAIKRIILMTDGGLGEDHLNPQATLDFLDEMNRDSFSFSLLETSSFLQHTFRNAKEDDLTWLILERMPNSLH